MKIYLKNIHKEFESRGFFETQRQSVLEDINFSIGGGDILGLIGKNGAGKSTLLKIILGLIEPTSGEIIFENDNKPIYGYVNCNPRSFFWRISARDNLIFYSKMLGVGKKSIDKNIKLITSMLNIEQFLDKPFMQLSSGQMQSVNIARALLKKPDMLLLDEPTTSLDQESSNSIINILASYLDDNKIPAIWCSHDYFELNRVCNKFGLLKDKKLIYKNSRVNSFNELAINYEFEVSNSDIKKVESKLKIKIHDKYSPDTDFFSPIESNLKLNDAIDIIRSSNVRILSLEKNFNYFENYII
jgi:ABC-type multidrug transport system ATPase subunit